MRILLINDDGIHAPGLQVLASTLSAAGYELAVAAPLHQRSGSGTSVGSELDFRLIATEAVELPGLPGVPAIAVDAPPALIALAVTHGLLDFAADAVVSGINHGHNIGRLSLYSGTLGAAASAALYGFPAMAVSCASGPQVRFAATAQWIASALATLVDHAQPGTVYNINYPARDPADIAGIRWATLTRAIPGDLRVSRETGGFRAEVNRPLEHAERGSDQALLASGHVTVTRLGAIYPEIISADPTAILDQLPTTIREVGQPLPPPDGQVVPR